MARDISVAFKASDKLTDSILKMRHGVKDLSRDITEYRKIQEQAFNQRLDQSEKIKKEKQALKDLKAAAKDSADGMIEDIRRKERSLALLNEEYRRLGRAASSAFSEERRLQEEISRNSNRNASRTNPLKGLAGAGLGTMFGESVKGAALQMATSAYGTTAGNMIGNIAGSTISGAAIGSIAGPIGAAVGAAVGGLSGVIKGLSENQQRDDDFFRTEVKSLFDFVKQDLKSSLDNGITRSTATEQNVNALTTLLGSEAKGEAMFEDIKNFGINTPYQAESMLNSAKQMLAYGIKETDLMNDVRMIGEVAMGNQAKFDALTYVYAQTQSAGKLNGQDLRQYTEAGFNPLKVLAEESGKTLQHMRDKMSDGLISAEDVTRAFKIASSEGGQFYGAMAKQMETYGGNISMLTDLKNEVDRAMGDGYTEERKKGLEKEIEMFSGKMGEQMQEAYSLIGTYQADLENKHQESIIKAITGAQNSDEYQKALKDNNGAEMGRIIADAKAKAEVEYKNSEGYRLQLEADLSIVKSIQEDAAMNNAYIEYGKKMADAFSLGYSSITKDALKESASEYLKGPSEKRVIKLDWDPWPNGKRDKNGNIIEPKKDKNGNATGLGRVPAEGYYHLHEGEKVVPKVDAQKTGGQVIVNNQFTINNNGQSTYEITKEIVAQISKASEAFAGGY